MLKFRNYLGEQPVYFVPDNGAEGGTATLTGPTGAFTVDERVESPTSERFGARVGFMVPEPFTETGTYLFAIALGDETTVYEIDVAEVGARPLSLINAPNIDLTVGD